MQTSSFFKKSSISLVATIAILSSSGAFAAEKGFYGALNASINQRDEESFDYAAGANIKSKFEDGYGGSGAVGYNFGKITPLGNIRTEVEGGYNRADIESHSLNGGAPLAGPTGKGEVTYGGGAKRVMIV